MKFPPEKKLRIKTTELYNAYGDIHYHLKPQWVKDTEFLIEAEAKLTDQQKKDKDRLVEFYNWVWNGSYFYNWEKIKNEDDPDTCLAL